MGARAEFGRLGERLVGGGEEAFGWRGAVGGVIGGSVVDVQEGLHAAVASKELSDQSAVHHLAGLRRGEVVENIRVVAEAVEEYFEA